MCVCVCVCVCVCEQIALINTFFLNQENAEIQASRVGEKPKRNCYLLKKYNRQMIDLRISSD